MNIADYFYFSLSTCRKNIVFGSNFRNWQFDLRLCFEVTWIRKSHFLAFGLWVWRSVINIIPKQIIAVTQNFLFYICILYWTLFETFYEDRTNGLHRGAHKTIRKQYSLWTEFCVSEFKCGWTTLSMMKRSHIFDMINAIWSTE